MKTAIGVFVFLFLVSFTASAQTIEERIKKLEDAIRKQEDVIREQQKELDVLKQQASVSRGVETKEASSASQRDYRLDDRSKGLYLGSSSPLVPYQLTTEKSSGLMNPAISLILNTFYYESSLSGEELESRRSPGLVDRIEPFQKGFNLESAELGFFSPVDPYFNVYATVPIKENGVELEEAYFVTTALPAGLQVKGGKFKSGFGRFNALHPHAWDFVDAPLNYLFFLGGEGLIEKGVQATVLPNLPIYTLFGMEALQGDNDILFGPEAHSGAHAFTGFFKSSFDFKENHTILFGGSLVGGKTRTASLEPGTELLGDSRLYGLELTYKWKPSRSHGFTLQSEYLYRSQKGDLSDFAAEVIDPLKRNQDGLYLQAIYQWERWRFGARFDRVGIFRDDFIRADNSIGYGQEPYRYTGMLEFNPTEFSRLRLQYNYGNSTRDRDADVNQEIFLQLILAIGAHGAHPF